MVQRVYRNCNAALLAMAGVLSFAAPAIAQCYYTYTPIPKPPGWLANPGQSINNLGAVAGILQSGGDNFRVYTWSAETGTVVLPLPPGIISMDSAVINDSGVVAGLMRSTTTWYMYVRNGTIYTTVSPPSGANTFYVSGINNRGEVTGAAWNIATGNPNPFVWRDGVLTDLGPQVTPDLCWGEAIDERGRVAGEGRESSTNPQRNRAFRLQPPAAPWLTQPDGASHVYATSNNEFVAGTVVPPSSGHAFGAVWLPSGEVALVPPPAIQNVRSQFWMGINDAGRAVGFYYPTGGRANVWQNGAVRLLQDLVSPPVPGTSIPLASGINRAGQIVISTNTTAAVLTPHWLPGDVTGDCHVTLEDLAIVLTNFGMPIGSFPMGDTNADGAVDLTDLAVVLTHWGE